LKLRPKWSAIARVLRRAAGLALVVALVAAAALWWLDRRYPFPLERLARPASVELGAVDGTELARRVAADGQWRKPAPLAKLGTWLPLATVAIEDRRFWSHPGVDARAVVRAAVVDLRARRVREGASTITMQLVGLTLETPRTFRGKLVEALRALQLERALEKEEILERYLALAPYGRNLSGAVTAAQRWFGKAPQDLSLDEAALLAGLPQGPSRLRPDRHPERALARRRSVLEALHTGGWIDEVEFERAAAAPLGLVGGAFEGDSSAPRARRTGATAIDASHVAGWALAQRPTGGTTLIEPDLQREVERIVAAHVPHLPPGTDVAVVIIDVERAALIALVGSADPTDPVDGQVDGARALRSPGSALKPLVYAAAFESGRFDARSILDDGPVELGGWRPSNFDGGNDGPVRLDEALRRSLNLPALRVAQAVGVERCIGLIEAAGARLEPAAASRAGLTLVTGGTPVRLVELTNVYATLARGGLFEPVRVFADEPRRTPLRAVTQRACEMVTAILSSSERAPSIRGGASHVAARPFMWKTGTSSGHVDALAVGHDGRVALGVWVGRFDGGGHPAYTGSEAAEPILAELFVGPQLVARAAGR